MAKHWNSVPEYDQINDGIDSYYRRFTDTEPLFSFPPEATVLDIDCRTGRGTHYFASKHADAEFVCLAMAESFVEQAKARLSEANVPANVSQIYGLPLEAGSAAYDLILCYETLEHVPDPAAFVAELGRVLRSEGTLVLTTPSVLWEPVHWLSATLHLDHGEGPHRMVPRREIYAVIKAANLKVDTETAVVLVPVGPKWLLRFGKWCERVLPHWLLMQLCLRRIFICSKP